MELLRPNPFDQLKEPTLNAALALINSIQPRSEMEALMAVQIVATGLSGIRYLRQSQHYMTSSGSTASPVKAISRRCSDACAEQAAGLIVKWRRDLQSRRDQLVAVTARYALPLTPTSVAMK